MPSDALKFLSRPPLSDSTMLLALSGWMDGGLVSTGTLKGLMRGRELTQFARIESDPFYIYNFPGSMEVAALFRPEVRYDDGMIGEIEMPSNDFYCDLAARLAFFTGSEPNLRWQSFADCIFEVAAQLNARRIVFMGSFGGSIPHTREPRLFASVSHPHLKTKLQQQGFRMSDYQGPGSFASMLLSQSASHSIEMMSLVAEIPGYLQGLNPLSIEAVTRRLSHILNMPVDLNELRRASNEWEVQVTQAVEKDSELAETVRKLEEQYDNELIGKAEEA